MVFRLGQHIITSFLLLCFSTAIHAQVFQRFTEDNGLPSNFVNDIAQDSMGFMWFATEAGLVRYDGVNSKVYEHQPNDPSSIAGDNPRVLHYGPSGNLWIASIEHNIDRYVEAQDTFEHHSFDVARHIPDARIYSIFEDGNILWLGGKFSLIRYDYKLKIAQAFSTGELAGSSREQLLNIVLYILPDKFNAEVLYLLTRGGLLIFNKRTGTLRQVPEPDSKILANQLGFRKALQLEDGNIWLAGVANGLAMYDPKSGSLSRFPKRESDLSDGFIDVHDFCIKTDSSFYVTTYNHSFGTFDKASLRYDFHTTDIQSAFDVQPPPIYKIFVDKQGNLWMGGNQGVSFYNPSFQTFNTISLPKRTIQHDKPFAVPYTFERVNQDEVLVGTVSGNGLYLANITQAPSGTLPIMLASTMLK